MTHLPRVRGCTNLLHQFSSAFSLGFATLQCWRDRTVCDNSRRRGETGFQPQRGIRERINRVYASQEHNQFARSEMPSFFCRDAIRWTFRSDITLR
jgi:hypothetical protein